MANQGYRVNSPQVATENLDNEVMVIHLVKGNYYSLSDTGAAVWTLLTSGRDEAAVFAEITAAYSGDSETIRQGIDKFAAELRAEELIVADDGAAAAAPRPAPVAPAGQPQFTAPQLEKYTDMQELLLIDPIHEVNDERGWPKMKP